MPLRDWLRGLDAPSEEQSDRDGVLSYAVEWHALTVGLAAGLGAGVSGRWELAGMVIAITLGVRAAPENVPRLGQLKREPWYALGGVVVGYFLGMGLPV
jgi:hypothetical protein